MNYLNYSVLLGFFLFFMTGPVWGQAPDSLEKLGRKSIYDIHINTAKTGKTFEGFGSLSAGASSRLLYDYPEPYRSEILDYLFKPDFGANLHHLKVEIGGDINSTDGSEPSIAATREEFNNPKEVYFKRGYEYWLMSEAKKRNPDIILEGLQWGAPGWIGNGTFYSNDNIEFVCAWVEGAKKYWNLDINYVGVRNEHLYDIDYIKSLRSGLDKHGLKNVLIDAGELWQLSDKWRIADDLMKDPDLMKAVGAINSHTTEELNYFTTSNVKKTGKPVWAGESHFYGSDWYAAANWARAIRSYVAGGVTKVINWSLISSYHSFLVVPGSGLMVANTPWSGYYQVLPSIWMLAHINQFAKPGWKYLDSGCKWWASEGSLREGLSMITLKDNSSDNYSIIVETMDAKEPQMLKIDLSNDLSANNLEVFRSVFKKEEFIQQKDIEVKDRSFSITVQPNSIYSLTTTRGQMKGNADHPIPVNTELTANYENDFEKQDLGTPAKYFSDQHGAFEVVERPDHKGKCLKQMSIDKGICWRCGWKEPETFVGDIQWKNYKASVDVLLPDTGKIILTLRSNGNPYTGYRWEIHDNGKWELKAGKDKILGAGFLKQFKGKWHQLEIMVNGSRISAKSDKKQLFTIEDNSITKGVAALGTGWNNAYFDNIKITDLSNN
jgi:galactosylceramidase